MNRNICCRSTIYISTETIKLIKWPKRTNTKVFQVKRNKMVFFVLLHFLYSDLVNLFIGKQKTSKTYRQSLEIPYCEWILHNFKWYNHRMNGVFLVAGFSNYIFVVVYIKYQKNPHSIGHSHSFCNLLILCLRLRHYFSDRFFFTSSLCGIHWNSNKWIDSWFRWMRIIRWKNKSYLLLFHKWSDSTERKYFSRII